MSAQRAHPHLIEARDLCYGTSAGSTRLIHGGLRHLEYLEFGLVFESLRELELLLRQRPWRSPSSSSNWQCKKATRTGLRPTARALVVRGDGGPPLAARSAA